MNRIMLIDDHPIVRLGIRTLLETRNEWQVCAEASSRQEAVELLQHESPEVAIVDLVLGMDDGLEFVKELRSQSKDLRILVMTMQDESVYAERVIRAGADGFIAKQHATDHLLEAVETVLGEEIYLSRSSSFRVLGRLLRDHADTEGDSPVSILSDRELHVFQMTGMGKANREISDNLGLSTKTIETYKENIKRKLSLPNADALKRAAIQWVETGKF
jgi:DNA-binding NarL/FixJ family response regulator